MRNLLLITLLYAGTVSAQTNFTFPSGNNTFQFFWEADNSNGHNQPHAAMLIPVGLYGNKKQCYMQFDSGSPKSFFYSNPVPNDTATAVQNYQFIIDKLPVTAKHISINKTNSSANSKIVGTLGTDLFAGKVLIIDYNMLQISVCDEVPASFKSDVKMNAFMFIQNSILLTGTIQTKSKMLYFDTGSSAFELLTDKKSFDALASLPLKERAYPVKSWQNTLTAHTAESRDSVVFAGKSIPLAHVTWMEGASDAQVNRMMAMGIGGLIGNELFIGHVLILDTKNKLFGIK